MARLADAEVVMAKARNRPRINPVSFPVFIGGFVLAAVGFYLAERYEASHEFSTKLWSVGLTELGFAFIISAVVYVLFEETMKRNDAKGIAAFLYGIETDSAYFKMIEDYIIRCPFYRFGTTVTFSFEEREGESYLIRYTIRYTVKNVSQVRQKFRIRGEVEVKPIHHKPREERQLGVVRASAMRDGKSLEPRFHISEAKSGPDTQRYESQEFALRPRQTLDVEIEHLIEKHDHDSDVWQAAMPCSGVVLRLEWRSEWPLRFAQEAFHPDADELAVKAGCDEGIAWREVTLDEPFMARHGIRFWWSSDGRRGEPAPIIPAIG